jgi:hypothetical protein
VIGTGGSSNSTSKTTDRQLPPPPQITAGNIRYVEYPTLKDAIGSEVVGRYSKFIYWQTTPDQDAKISDTMWEYRNEDYNFFWRNCGQCAVRSIETGGIDLRTVGLIAPIEYYHRNKDRGYASGVWPSADGALPASNGDNAGMGPERPPRATIAISVVEVTLIFSRV